MRTLTEFLKMQKKTKPLQTLHLSCVWCSQATLFNHLQCDDTTTLAYSDCLVRALLCPHREAVAAGVLARIASQFKIAFHSNR